MHKCLCDDLKLWMRRGGLTNHKLGLVFDRSATLAWRWTACKTKIPPGVLAFIDSYPEYGVPHERRRPIETQCTELLEGICNRLADTQTLFISDYMPGDLVLYLSQCIDLVHGHFTSAGHIWGAESVARPDLAEHAVTYLRSLRDGYLRQCVTALATFGLQGVRNDGR